MGIRTDLACEASVLAGKIEGISTEERTDGGIRFTVVTVETEQAARKIGKPVGKYITADVGDISKGLAETDGAAGILAAEISSMLSGAKTAMVVGLGNSDITPDALGPKTAAGVLATRHIMGDFAEKIGLTGLRSVMVLTPGVLGSTGMEATEIINATVRTTKPDAVIAVDALTAADTARLGTTVQIGDCGIAPGSGVGNRRRELSRETLGVPVISLGVPTVVELSSVGGKGAAAGMIVTPREIDLLISRASELLSHALNFALQPDIDREIILSLV